VVVLDRGEKLTEGRPEDVARDERVITAYLETATVPAPSGGAPLLEDRQAQVAYGTGLMALQGVSLDVRAGEAVALATLPQDRRRTPRSCERRDLVRRPPHR
jgi:hypothetical protein